MASRAPDPDRRRERRTNTNPTCIVDARPDEGGRSELEVGRNGRYRAEQAELQERTRLRISLLTTTRVLTVGGICPTADENRGAGLLAHHHG